MTVQGEARTERGVKRAQWGVIASLMLSACSLVFTGGVVYGQVQAQEVRIDKLDQQSDALQKQISDQAVIMAGVSANVQFLVDQERERTRRNK